MQYQKDNKISPHPWDIIHVRAVRETPVREPLHFGVKPPLQKKQ